MAACCHWWEVSLPQRQLSPAVAHSSCCSVGLLCGSGLPLQDLWTATAASHHYLVAIRWPRASTSCRRPQAACGRGLLPQLAVVFCQYQGLDQQRRVAATCRRWLLLLLGQPRQAGVACDHKVTCCRCEWQQLAVMPGSRPTARTAVS